jgi:hypothetical protein
VGRRKTIAFAVRADESCPGLDFYEELDRQDKAKLNALFRMLGDQGEIRNKEKFKKIEGTEFFEFKSFQIRMPCFFLPGNLVVITHGFRKKKDKAPPAEVERARLIKQEDEAASRTSK